MDYFLYKHINQPILKKEDCSNKTPHSFVLMHYCKKCKTKIWGMWQFPREMLYYEAFCYGEREDNKALDVINSDEYKNILEYGREFLNFFELEKCPVCEADLTNEKPYLFDELGNLEMAIQYKRNGKMIYKDIDKSDYIAVGEIHIYNRKDVLNIDTIEKGQTAITPRGNGELYWVNDKEDTCGVIHYHAESFESIHNYVVSAFKSILYKPKSEEMVKSFLEKSSFEDDSEQQQIVLSRDELTKYLEHLIKAEDNIYFLTERLKKLYELSLELTDSIYSTERLYIQSLYATSNKLLSEYNNTLNTDPSKKVLLKDFACELPIKPKKPEILKPEPPILVKIGLFNKKKAIETNEKIMCAYQESLNRYNQVISEYEQDIKIYNKEVAQLKKEQKEKYKAEILKVKTEHNEKCSILKQEYEAELIKVEKLLETNKEIVTDESILLENIKQEISTIEELLIKSLKTRAELYSYNIVFEKYRDIVALSTFYEYLSSYRCDELIGANGAYNLYENETRMNMVVSQLSKVINRLEEIKENQYKLYSVINKSNIQLQKLNDGMSVAIKSLAEIHKEQERTNYTLNSINETADLIAYNTAATAFYAKRNTEITAAIGFMMALN